MHKLAITYNSAAKIAAITPWPWSRLGPEQWFDAYRVVASNPIDAETDFIKIIGGNSDDRIIKTAQIVTQQEFASIARSELADYRFVLSRPTVLPVALDPDRFASPSQKLNQYDNKRIFRETFASELPFAEYQIIDRDQVLAEDSTVSFATLSATFGTSFVIQDEDNGGRATYLIHSKEDYQQAMQTLRREVEGKHLVISRCVRGLSLIHI